MELIREALSNAKDHVATRFWFRSSRDARNQVDILFMDDGEGLTLERLAAFWGIGASSKVEGRPRIGYKGHGTKLYFDCDQLSCATNTDGVLWQLTTMQDPGNSEAVDVPIAALPEEHRLRKEITAIGLTRGTAILMQGVKFHDSARLLSRAQIESYCDWFTFVGDVRSGLFDTRRAWHDAIEQGAIAGLLSEQVPISPLAIHLRINGEQTFSPLGFGKSTNPDSFFGAWQDDVRVYANNSGLCAFGHRFADVHLSESGATRVRDDLSAIRLTSSLDWSDANTGLSIVARIEGHRRQRETYREAQWQNHSGVYGFESRFGLWLCRDFIPIVRRNELLQEAIERATKHRLRYELGSTRNWQVFVNHQAFLPTANRGGISNESQHIEGVIAQLSSLLERAFKNDDFRTWVERLRSATLAKRRAEEAAYMDERREKVRAWYAAASPKRSREIELTGAEAHLEQYEDTDSILLREPSSEQEVFYIYALLAGRYRLPVHILEYDAQEGVDAIALLRERALVPGSKDSPFIRLEMKNVVTANNSLQHFFEAIDCVVCWRVDRTGDIFERESQGDVGVLTKRKPVLASSMDTYQIEHQHQGAARLIPVLELSKLWPTTKKPRARG